MFSKGFMHVLEYTGTPPPFIQGTNVQKHSYPCADKISTYPASDWNRHTTYASGVIPAFIAIDPTNPLYVVIWVRQDFRTHNLATAMIEQFNIDEVIAMPSAKVFWRKQGFIENPETHNHMVRQNSAAAALYMVRSQKNTTNTTEQATIWRWRGTRFRSTTGVWWHTTWSI
jgi:hypothetical protein